MSVHWRKSVVGESGATGCGTFPQLDGLGRSSTARFYGIKGIQEAQAFIKHEILGPRLRECAEAVLSVEGKTPEEIFGFLTFSNFVPAQHCSPKCANLGQYSKAAAKVLWRSR